VRALTCERDRVTGVVTDVGRAEADTVVLAAGPWSAPLVRPLGVELPVWGSRGWIVDLAGEAGWLRHLVEEEEEEDEPATSADAVRPGEGATAGEGFPTAGEFAAAGHRPTAVAALLHTAEDGIVVCGASHHPALRSEPDDERAPRRIVERAIAVAPRLAGAPIRAVRWGIRPMSPDGRPLVGWVRDGLFAATGHGAEGVLFGGGTAVLAAALITGAAPPFDPAAFDPLRFPGVAGT
jgi:glycine/D-amino acid oxidase-like deaminating enzyme